MALYKQQSTKSRNQESNTKTNLRYRRLESLSVPTPGSSRWKASIGGASSCPTVRPQLESLPEKKLLFKLAVVSLVAWMTKNTALGEQQQLWRAIQAYLFSQSTWQVYLAWRSCSLLRPQRGNDTKCTIRSTGTNTVLRPDESRQGDGRKKNYRFNFCQDRALSDIGHTRGKKRYTWGFQILQVFWQLIGLRVQPPQG